MPRINLLPWREARRTQRRNQFYMGLGAAVLAAGLVTFAANQTMERIIGHQQARNDLLQSEITALDERIAEIRDLEAKRDRLLARMEIIEQLQRSRPEIVHLFDELVRALPEGVYLTSVKQSGSNLEIRGSAESNTRVSAFMRNIDASDWMTRPDLQVVEVRRASGGGRDARNGAGTRSSEFTVTARQVSATAEEQSR